MDELCSWAEQAAQAAQADAAATSTSISLPRTNISSNFAINLSLLHSFRTGPMTLSSCPLPTHSTWTCALLHAYSLFWSWCLHDLHNLSSSADEQEESIKRGCSPCTRQSSLSVSININALSDNFFSLPHAQGSCRILNHSVSFSVSVIHIHIHILSCWCRVALMRPSYVSSSFSCGG